MKHLKSAFLLFVVVLSAPVLFAQVKTISGTVKDSKGQPLEGVVIKIKNKTTTSTTDKAGAFSIAASNTDVLLISSEGFQSTSLKADAGKFSIVLADETKELQEVVLLGSRKGGRVKTESPVPVDVINMNAIGQNTARADLTSQLNMAVPSFNYNKQSGADGSDAIDFASLRGLGYDQTLVLINGKRRHLSAFVNEFGTRGRGTVSYTHLTLPTNREV